MKRTPPFPGFSRGLPIIGENKGPAPGAYYYQVPALIKRAGEPLDAETFEICISQPLEGVRFKTLASQIAEGQRMGDDPPPKVILLPPFFLGFVPQDEVDRQKRAAAPGSAES